MRSFFVCAGIFLIGPGCLSSFFFSSGSEQVARGSVPKAPAARTGSALRGCCTADLTCSQNPFEEGVYMTLAQWCRSRFPDCSRLPDWKKTLKLRKKLKEGKPLTPQENNALSIRRLVKQHPKLTRPIVTDILNDQSIKGGEFTSLDGFISVFGMLASTRVGFRNYYQSYRSFFPKQSARNSDDSERQPEASFSKGPFELEIADTKIR